MKSPSSPFYTFVFTVLASSIAIAQAGSHDIPGRRHHALSVNITERSIEKRFDNARFTYYDAGVNACGSFDQPNDFVSISRNGSVTMLF